VPTPIAPAPSPSAPPALAACVDGPAYTLATTPLTSLVAGEPASYDLVLQAQAAGECAALDAALRLELGPLRTGDLAALVLSITNPGTIATRGPRTVVVALPPGVTYERLDAGPDWECTARDNLVVCTHLDPANLVERDRAVRLPLAPDDPEGEPTLLAPGAVDRLTLVLKVAENAPAQALVRARLLEAGDARPANDFAQVTAPIEGGQGERPLPPLAEPWRTLLDPTATPPVLLNWLPAGFTYLSATGEGWACDALGQTVLCTVPPGSAARSDAVEQRVTVAVEVAPEAPERVLTVAGLSTARTPATQPVAVTGICAPVQDSPTPVADLPPLCQPAATESAPESSE
jgi:hypothetical protein